MSSPPLDLPDTLEYVKLNNVSSDYVSLPVGLTLALSVLRKLPYRAYREVGTQFSDAQNVSGMAVMVRILPSRTKPKMNTVQLVDYLHTFRDEVSHTLIGAESMQLTDMF